MNCWSHSLSAQQALRWRHQARLVLILLLAEFCVNVSAGYVNAQSMEYGYECQGEMLYQVFSADKVEVEESRLFQVRVQGCNWIIRNWRVGGSCFYETGYTNGLLLHLVGYYTNSSPATRLTNYVGLIESDQIPEDNFSLHGYVWLAYASACYFDSITGPNTRPVCCLDDRTLRKEAFTVPTLLERHQTLPKLPLLLQYINDGNYRLRDTKLGKRFTISVPAPFDKGYTNATFKSQDMVPVSSFAIPKQFTFERFGVKTGISGQQATLRTRALIQGRLTDAKLLSRPLDVQPGFYGQLMVKDTRVLSPNPSITNIGLAQVHYPITNGIWFNKSSYEKANQEQIRQYLRSKEAPVGARASIAQSALLTALLVSSFGLVCFWIRLCKQ